MDIKKLLSGIAIIIDDKIKKEDSNDLILKIRDQLKENNISILEYEDLPADSEIQNFKNISFILLDWELFARPEPGIPMDETLFINNNIEFLKEINEVSFTPVFIFSNQSPDSIIRKLSEEGLYNDDSNNYIFIKRKQDIISDNDKNLLFTQIENWLKATPSMYVLKEWEHSLNKAKRDLFWSFYDINHNWPSVLQKTFTDDGSDVNYELGNFVYKNIIARTKPIEFDEEILKLEDDHIIKNDIRKILEAERFMKNDSLPKNIPYSGDLFELSDYEIKKGSKKEKKRYYLNIRPDCDIIRDKDTKKGRLYKTNENNFNPQLYCLECEVIKDKDIEELFNKGAIDERVNNLYIPFVNNGKILKINLDWLRIFKWKESLFDKDDNETDNKFKEKRIGRILPPYITKVQQKYAFYLQRQGLPAIPEKAIK